MRVCCRPLRLNARYGDSGKSLEWKKRYSRESAVFLMQNDFHYLQLAMKLTGVAGHKF